MFRFGYRWSCWRDFWGNLRTAWYDIRYGVENLIVWLPVIWFDRDWDWCFLVQLMEKKFRRMAHLQEHHGNTVGAPRLARQLRICALLCKRLDEENYSRNSAKFFKYGSRAWANEWSAVQKQDKEMLGRLIGKYLDHWWD